MGAGLITGAADDDPSGIATYSQAGAQFGFSLGWTLLLTYPLMVAIQASSARIGRTTGLGIAGNLRVHRAAWILNLIVVLLLIANTCNIGADLAAMTEAGQMIVPVLPARYLLLTFCLISMAGQLWFNYTRYVAILKWLTLSLFSYFAVLCVVHVHWPDFFGGLIFPHFSGQRDFWLMVTALLGTTISPYLFFWQAAQEVEDTKARPVAEALKRRPNQGARALERIRIDTLIGMAFSNLVALAIMATAGATLHVHHLEQIDSAAQAAEALRPLAGNFAFALFALGIIATGVLAIPVLAGSAAYALGEARGWPVGLARQPQQAKAFYATIAAATFLGAATNVLAISPVKALVWSAVLNALVAVPVMVLIMQMAVSTRVMGEFKVSGTWQVLGWLATAVMAAASAFFLVTSLTGHA